MEILEYHTNILISYVLAYSIFVLYMIMEINFLDYLFKHTKAEHV